MKRKVKILSLVMVLTITVMMMPAMTFKLSAAPTVTEQDGTYNVIFKYTNPDVAAVYIAGDFNCGVHLPMSGRWKKTNPESGY